MKAKWRTRMIAAVCAAGVVCSLVNVNALAAAVPAAFEDAVFEVQSGIFTYIPKAGADPAEDTYYYSDGYFQDSSIGENSHLASMSMALAFSTFENGGSSYVRDLFGKIGYGDIAVGDMDDTPTRDTIGTAIAHKNVNGQEIVAVAIRGSRYYSEWAANLTAGAQGDIEGVAKPAETVIARIRDYISANKLQNVKLWITGYSRAGSVADLVGVYVNEHPEEFGTTQEDAFVYAFEPMHCAADSTYYGNIICYLNKNDIVGYVYPESWGMHLNGAVIPLGESKTITEKEIHLTADEKVQDIGTITLEEFLPKFIDFITTDLTRDVFSGDCDDAVADILEMFVRKTPEEQQALVNWLKNDLLAAAQEYENDRLMYIATGEIYSGIMQHNSDKMYRQLSDDVLILLDKVTENCPSPLSADEAQMIRDNLYPLLRAVGPVLMRDALYNEECGVNSPFEEGYDDPDYDPQTAETQLMTYEQYTAKLAQLEAEEQERRNNMTDYERGYENGTRAEAWTNGYNDGKEDAYLASYDDTVPDSENMSAEYIEGFKQGYHDDYEDGFECGYSNEVDTRTDEEIGYDVGRSAGYDAAWQDALNGEAHYRESYDDTPFADEYNPYEDEAAYNAGFVRGYAEGYEESFPEQLAWQHQLQMEQPLYHVGTFLLNIQDILDEHHPQTNLKLVQETDSYYTELNAGMLTISYYDAASFERKTARATLLNGTETALSSGWYAVNQDVTIEGDLTLDGNVNLILADGCTLTVNGAVTGDYALNIYGQSEEYGTLAAESVSVDSYQQSGGIVRLSSDADNALNAKTEVTVLGGQLAAEGGIAADALTLSYVYSTDFIQASAYTAETVTIGEYFAFYIPNLTGDFLDGYALDCTLHLTENGAVGEPVKADFIGKLAYKLPVLEGELDETAVSFMQGQKLCPYIDYSGLIYYDADGNPYTDDSMPARQTVLTDSDFDMQAIEKQGDSYICHVSGKGDYTGTAVLELPVYSEEGQIADDATLLAWAEKDYQDKYDTVVTASVAEKENGSMTIRLTDETGKVVDQYVIDTATGIGTDSVEEEVNLPQTGNNEPGMLLMIGAALIMLLAGAFAVKQSGKATAAD